MESRARTLTPADEMRLFAGLAVQPFVAAGVAFVGFPVFLLDRTGRTLAAGVPSDPTAAAMSPASTSLMSSRLFACILSRRPIRSRWPLVLLSTVSPVFMQPE